MHPQSAAPGSRLVAVVAHGSGSTAELMRRMFAPALADHGGEVVALDDRTGSVQVVADRLGRLVDAVAASGSTEVLVGGVSLGAHAAAVVAASRPWLRGLLLVLPAWTGAPGPVAALSAAAADQVEREGLAPTLATLERGGWVGAEVARAWPTYGQRALVAALRATAASPGPTPAQLRSITVPTSVVGLPDDAFHPAEVARTWASLVPLAGLDLAPMAQDDVPEALGRRSVRAWRALSREGSAV